MKRGAIVPIFNGVDKSCPANYRHSNPYEDNPIVLYVLSRIKIELNLIGGYILIICVSWCL